MAMDPYQDLDNLSSLSIKERAEMFRQTALKMLAQGKDIRIIKMMVADLEEKEMYEGAQGVLLAITEFENNPQLRIL